MYNHGLLLNASMNRNHLKWSNLNVRGDLRCWLSPQKVEKKEGLGELWRRVREMREEMECRTGFGHSRKEVQLACYPG